MPDSDKTNGAPRSKKAPSFLREAVDWVEFVAFLAAAKTVERLPDKLCYFLAACLGRIFFAAAFGLSARTVRNLQHAGVAKDKAEATRIARRTFVSFFKLLVDIFKAGEKVRPERISEFLRVSGPESSKRLFFPTDGSKPSQAIIACGHFGNWEVAGQAYALRTGLPLMSVMRPFDNKRIGDYILARRAGNNHSVCDKRGGVRVMLRALKAGSSISILPDQHASTKDGGVVVQFFGHPARTHTAPALLHLHTGIPILPLLCRRVDDGFHFEFIITEPIVHKPTGDKDADVLAITQKVNDALESIIRQCPEQWLWAHRRWLDLDR